MNTHKKYWLGYEEPNEQDRFFLDALDKSIWSAGSKNNWDACWSTEMPDPGQFELLNANKTINHLPGNSALTIKSNLYSTLQKAKLAVKGLPQEQRYQFFPKTYSMPTEYFDFQQAACDKPEVRWIQKPRNMSRGRGIEVVQHSETVPLGNQWIIQEYLDKPHLWDGFKYVLRCYVLVTSIEPLRFYWYHEGSTKLTSEQYDLDDLDNPYRHLTNPDINEQNSEIEVPVVFHSFASYKEWLRAQDIDDEKLFAQIQDLISLTVIAAREKMRDQAQRISTDTQGAYELLGLDLVVDSDIKPWILECNLSPSLEICSTDQAQAKKETQTKKGMVSEIVNMLGLNDHDQDTLTDEQKAQRELDRANGFTCLFPTQTANDYLNCFPVPRFADINSLPSEVQIDYNALSLTSKDGIEAMFDDSLALLAHDPLKQIERYIVPNEVATWIWIQNSEGSKPDEIAQELATNFAEQGSSLEAEKTKWLAQIWDMLADWSQASLFSQSKINNPFYTDTPKPEQQWQELGYFNCAGVSLQIRCACNIAARYLKTFTTPQASYTDAVEPVDVIRSSYGYVLINDTRVMSGSRKLSQLIDECIKLVAQQCLQANDLALITGSVVSVMDKNVLIVGNQEQLDGFAYEFCQHNDHAKMLSGPPILTMHSNSIKCTDLPLRLPSNTDFISSSYDASNYYPKKPESVNSKQEPITKQEWAISETKRQPCWLAPANGNYGEEAKINAIVFLESHGDPEQEPRIDAISSAQTIEKLWLNSLSKKSTATTYLPEWLNGIQTYMLLSDDLKQAKSMITHIGKLFD